jgi:hypothetical protein
MFSASNFLRKKHAIANEHGFNAAMLGLDNANPYPLGTTEHKEWEWGWNEGQDTLEEHVNAHNDYSISNEYESGWM